MKFFTSFFEFRTSKQSKVAELSSPVDAKASIRSNVSQKALSKQEAHDKEAIAQAYLHYGPRVARHMARNIKKTSSKEDHTCPRSEILVLH